LDPLDALPLDFWSVFTFGDFKEYPLLNLFRIKEIPANKAIKKTRPMINKWAVRKNLGFIESSCVSADEAVSQNKGKSHKDQNHACRILPKVEQKSVGDVTEVMQDFETDQQEKSEHQGVQVIAKRVIMSEFGMEKDSDTDQSHQIDQHRTDEQRFVEQVHIVGWLSQSVQVIDVNQKWQITHQPNR
jgi:hypothetical protein